VRKTPTCPTEGKERRLRPEELIEECLKGEKGALLYSKATFEKKKKKEALKCSVTREEKKRAKRQCCSKEGKGKKREWGRRIQSIGRNRKRESAAGGRRSSAMGGRKGAYNAVSQTYVSISAGTIRKKKRRRTNRRSEASGKGAGEKKERGALIL